MTVESGSFNQFDPSPEALKKQGARWKAMRLRGGVTLNSLSKEMGFSNSRKMRRWERGDLPIPAEAWGHATLALLKLSQRKV